MKKTIEFVNSVVRIIKKKIRETKDLIWWHFNGERWMREYDEEQNRLDAEFKVLQEHLDLQEAEENAKLAKIAEEEDRAYEAYLEAKALAEDLADEEYYRRQDEKYQAQEDAYEEHLRKLREEENGCYYCGRVNCSCNDRAEDFSEGPYIDPEEEPLSPEMEYWFTPCSKCGKYPEFCPCDGKFED